MTPLESGVQAWFEKAESDRLCIENNLAASRAPWDTVVFHAQQAAEKLLKALLVAAGEAVPRTHDLGALLSLAMAAASRLRGAVLGLLADGRASVASGA